MFLPVNMDCENQKCMSNDLKASFWVQYLCGNPKCYMKYGLHKIYLEYNSDFFSFVHNTEFMLFIFE